MDYQVFLISEIQQHRGEGVGEEEVAGALGADLEQDGDIEVAVSRGVERGCGEGAQVLDGGGGIGDDRRPEVGRAERFEFLGGHGEGVAEEGGRELVPVAGGGQREEVLEELRRGGGGVRRLVQHQPTHPTRSSGGGIERDACAVRMAQQEYRLADRSDQRDEVPGLVGERADGPDQPPEGTGRSVEREAGKIATRNAARAAVLPAPSCSRDR